MIEDDKCYEEYKIRIKFRGWEIWTLFLDRVIREDLFKGGVF